MSRIAIQPMQWARVEDLQDVEPLSDDDFECMQQVREVLARHGKPSRFALHLIHKHFDIEADEILVEYSDGAKREQTCRPEKATSEMALGATPTTWSLQHIEPLATCRCARTVNGHLGRHPYPGE